MASSVMGIELDEKSQAQAMKDLADSKIQASVLLKERLKAYDLNRLPPQYQKLLKKHLFGNVPSQKELSELKARYDKIISDTMKSAANGPGGDLKRLEKLFSDIVSGKVQFASNRIPFTPSGTKIERVKRPTKVSKVTKTKLAVPSGMDGIENIINQVHPSVKDSNSKKELERFVIANKKKRSSYTIFSIHSKTYLNDIYNKIK